jgi:enediyne biosynthesis protein E9
MNILKTEALIVGSGFGAAAPALRLTERGVKVLMIEKGPDIVPSRDFRQTSDPRYLLRYLKSVDSNSIGFTYAEGLGGGSGFYEMVSLRTPTIAFEQRDPDGYRYWPNALTRSQLDPYYDIAEKMLNVEQIAEDEVPKSGVVFSYMMKRLGYSCERCRYAVKGCFGSGFCVSGCIFGAKQSLHENYLPQAKELGLQVMTDVEAWDIQTIPHEPVDDHTTLAEIPYRYEVKCRHGATGEFFTIQAKLVVLGGGTVGTAQLLMRSKENMPFLSDHVGKNIAFNGGVKAVGLLPEGFIEGDMLSGRSHPGMISYQFLESHGITIAAAKPLPLQVVTTARLVLDGDPQTLGDWGEAGDKLMKLYRHRMIILVAFGLTPPVAHLNRSGDGSMEPVLDLTPELRSYYQNVQSILDSIFTRNGCELVKVHMIDGEGTDYKDIHYGTAHMVGSARMADSKKHGVVDANGEVFDYPGLYVSDGAAIPTSLSVNTSLTILANAERIGHVLVKKYSRKNAMINLPLVDKHT